MDLRQLEIIRAIAETGSFTAAGHKLHVSQSAISRQILLLEDESTVSGVIKSEDKKVIKLMTAENKEITVPVEDVASRRTGPSAMPADLHQKLTRRELRDVVEFLTSLKEPPKK